MNKRTLPEIVGKFFMAVVIVVAAASCIYPFLYILSMSISSPEHVLKRDVFFFPKGFGTAGYELAFKNKSIWTAYGNTIFYTFVGTAVNIVMTVLAAYPLSREKFFLRRSVCLFIAITLFINGGMIPFFIIVSNLGLYNTRMAMILPFAVSAWNIIIARTFYEQIHESLAESAKIDGANDIVILIKIMLPLSGPILAVLTLFYAVGYWNSYFWPLVFLPSVKLQPLQLYLYKILVQLKQDQMGGVQIGISRTAQTEQLKYASIIISTVPILVVYPYLQKYFVKGVMIGAIKG